ncbi:hypothetical protein [Nostoc sp. 'Peltigera membranacea cyanobiont' 232]|uniref:hypothetical protein n=1 Tax=Nostoc sp. 'Peltigera membranacea cyanobiont' 232 TaxID=2014531 RepID=UPI000B953CD2|nr:hypothetical protein [Nostoc sp. 'Peltigera membranacea cyanobiont' 232]OYE00373.1 hypothetical protein CDG79_35585 [Nostoc sp. 'Peltigera membranacea cyanobiont' 232]
MAASPQVRSLPPLIPHAPEYLFLFWWRGGEAIRCSSNIRGEKLRLQKWCQRAIAQCPMTNDQYPMPNALKIDWRFWGFGSHGLVVVIW